MENTSSLEVPCSRKVKPRAIVLKASNGDFEKISSIIKEQLPEVEVLYVTTAPPGTFLHISRSVPFEKQDSSINAYCVERT